MYPSLCSLPTQLCPFWLGGHSPEHGQPTRGYILKTNFPSPGSCELLLLPLCSTRMTLNCIVNTDPTSKILTLHQRRVFYSGQRPLQEATDNQNAGKSWLWVPSPKWSIYTTTLTAKVQEALRKKLWKDFRNKREDPGQQSLPEQV